MRWIFFESLPVLHTSTKVVLGLILLAVCALYLIFSITGTTRPSVHPPFHDPKLMCTDNTCTTSPNDSSTFLRLPSIWMIGLLNLNTRTSHCDYHKTGLSRHMFWNEHLYQELLWVIDDNPVSIRIAETNYRFVWPFPKFIIGSVSHTTMQSMQRINNHSRLRSPQYELQQWATFYLDTYADRYASMNGLPSPRILAIVDSDAQLQTLATFESIFPEYNRSHLIYKHKLNIEESDSDFKLIAHGLDVQAFAEATRLLLNRSQPANFMVTFPIYVYKSTLTNLREYVSKLHTKTFDVAFEQAVTTATSYYSQFAIILTYAYWFENERYSFHAQPSKSTLVDKPVINNSLQYRFNPKPPVRVMLHTKNALLTSIQKSCCFSYQLNRSETMDDLKINNDTKHKVSHICNAFGSIESQFEMVCQNPYTHDFEQQLIWRQNNTITEHYQRVQKALETLSKGSIRRKKHICVQFLIDPTTQAWFTRGASCTFP